MKGVWIYNTQSLEPKSLAKSPFVHNQENFWEYNLLNTEWRVTHVVSINTSYLKLSQGKSSSKSFAAKFIIRLVVDQIKRGTQSQKE